MAGRLQYASTGRKLSDHLKKKSYTGLDLRFPSNMAASVSQQFFQWRAFVWTVLDGSLYHVLIASRDYHMTVISR